MKADDEAARPPSAPDILEERPIHVPMGCECVLPCLCDYLVMWLWCVCDLCLRCVCLWLRCVWVFANS